MYICVSYADGFELNRSVSWSGLVRAGVSCGNVGGKGDLAAAGQDVREGEGCSRRDCGVVAAAGELRGCRRYRREFIASLRRALIISD